MDNKRLEEKELIEKLMKENYKFNPREESKITKEIMTNYDLGEGSLDQEEHLIELIDNVAYNLKNKISKVIDKVRNKLRQ